VGTAWRDYMQDDEPSFLRSEKPRVTWRLLWTLVGLWLLYAGSLGWGGADGGLFRLIHDHLALHPADVLERGHVWQVVTAIFLHDPFGISHILMNGIFLFFFGTMIESILGGRGMFRLFLIAGLACTLSVLIVYLVRPFSGPALGASGGIFGLGVFLAFRRPHVPVIFIVIRMPLWVLVGVILVGLQLVQLLVFANAGPSTIGHLAGALYGFVHHRWVAPRDGAHDAGPGLLARWRTRRRAGQERRAAARTADEKARVEVLLDKISRDGIGSLTGAEKDFLQRASKRYPHA
jgi:membrane associated rhomboid family serine protease